MDGAVTNTPSRRLVGLVAAASAAAWAMVAVSEWTRCQPYAPWTAALTFPLYAVVAFALLYGFGTLAIARLPARFAWLALVAATVLVFAFLMSELGSAAICGGDKWGA